jgi:hypothetical protein
MQRALIVSLIMLLDVGAAEAEVTSVALAYDGASSRLSAAVETTPATDLLQAVAEATGIRVRTRGDVGRVRAQTFTDLPLEEAIQRLFRSPDRSLTMLYELAPDGGQRLAEVRLAARASADAARTPPQAEAPQLLAAAPPLAMLPPPPMHLRLPPPPPPPRRR